MDGNKFHMEVKGSYRIKVNSNAFVIPILTIVVSTRLNQNKRC